MVATPSGGAGRKSERTRERIVDATARTLNRRGFAGTRLSDIAELAEVQAPAIYYYFSSREELIEEAVSLGLARAEALIAAALDQVPTDASAMDRIDAAIEAHLTTLLTHSEHAAAAVRTVAQLPADMRERQLTAQRAYVAIWRRMFEEARNAGEIDPELEPRAALMLVLGALNWTVEWWDPDSGPLPEVIRTAKSIVGRGLAPRT